MSSKNPGFNKENIVVVDASDTKTKEIYPLFRQAMISRGGYSGYRERGTGFGGK